MCWSQLEPLKSAVHIDLPEEKKYKWWNRTSSRAIGALQKTVKPAIVSAHYFVSFFDRGGHSAQYRLEIAAIEQMAWNFACSSEKLSWKKKYPN